MSWRDRDYARRNDPYGSVPGAGMFRSLTGGSVVMTIIIVNVVVYLVQDAILAWGVLVPQRVVAGEVWRLLTATLLHADFGHIFFNMLGVFFFGPLVESRWGGRATLALYVGGGLLGSVAYVGSAYLGFIGRDSVAVGASGCVLTLLGAGAVLAPNQVFLVMGIVPARLRTLAIVYTCIYLYNVFNRGQNHGGDLVHLVGLGCGAWWAYRGKNWWDLRGRFLVSGLGRARSAATRSTGRDAAAFGSRMRQREVDQADVDRILKKVHDGGVHTLSEAEKRTLTEATERLRAADRHVRGAERT